MKRTIVLLDDGASWLTETNHIILFYSHWWIGIGQQPDEG